MEKFAQVRLQSADVFRGIVMLLMMGEVLQFSAVSEAIPNSYFWKFISFHQSHVPWVGCSLHDLIQPSFTFLVGLVLPLSLLSRKKANESFSKMLLHSIWRAFILVVLGIFLRSMHGNMTYYTFEDTLSQIGLGNVFIFLLGFCTWRVQLGAFMLILFSYWLLFALYPLPIMAINFDSLNVDPAWKYNLSGFAAHWNINANPAWAFDKWYLNLFPRESPFIGSPGGYSTISFIPTLATMIFGLLVSQVLLRSKANSDKIRTLIIVGVGSVIVGSLLGWLGICPVVKRIWTPSWVLYSGGFCTLIIAFLYFVIDIKQKVKWAFLFKIVGMNSIAAYVFAHTIDGFIASSFKIHLGAIFFDVFGKAYHNLFLGFCVLAIECVILLYMYRKKIFIRI